MGPDSSALPAGAILSSKSHTGGRVGCCSPVFAAPGCAQITLDSLKMASRMALRLGPPPVGGLPCRCCSHARLSHWRRALSEAHNRASASSRPASLEAPESRRPLGWSDLIRSARACLSDLDKRFGPLGFVRQPHAKAATPVDDAGPCSGRYCLIQIEAWAGWTARLTASSRSARIASISTASRSRDVNAATVASAL